jgi:glycosyltransferase involved in cell wall biosynthesis
MRSGGDDVHVTCEADFDRRIGVARVVHPFGPLPLMANVTVHERNRLNGLWTVSVSPDSAPIVAPSVFFASASISDERFALRHIVLPTEPIPIEQRSIGCTVIVQTYSRERHGAAVALTRRLSAFRDVVAVVLLNNRVDLDFNASRMEAKHAPIVLLQNLLVPGPASVANRWRLPESAVGTHCAIVMEDDMMPAPEAVHCMMREAIDAHATNSAVAQIGMRGVAHFAPNNTYARPSNPHDLQFRYNMVLSGQSTFVRFGCVREWFAAAPAAAHDIVAHQAAHCDDVLVTLLLAQHDLVAVRLGGALSYDGTLATFSGMSRVAANGSAVGGVQRFAQRGECVALLRSALRVSAPPLVTNVALPCAAERATRVANVAVTVNEFFNRSFSNFGGFAQAASMYIGANFADPSFADFGATGRIAITFVCCAKLRNPPTHDHTHPVVFVEQFLADVRNGTRPRPDLVLTIDCDLSYMPVIDAFNDVPVLLWARNPTPDSIKQYRATLRLPTLPNMTVASAMETLPDRRALLRQLTREKRVVFVASLDAQMAERNRAYVEIGADAEEVLSDSVVGLLCNPLELVACNVSQREHSDQFWRHSSASKRLRVVLLGRIDPIKRPWVALEIAARMPDVDFTFAGEQFIKFGNLTPAFRAYETHVWQRMRSLPNVRWLPHVDVANRTQLLCSADALLSTSISEGVPLSFLEAMAAGVAIVGQTNTANVTTRFGTLVPGAPGDGLNESSLAAYVSVLQQMRRAKLANVAFASAQREQARLYIQKQSSPANFRRQLIYIFGLLLW